MFDSTKAAGILTWDLVDQYEALERWCVGSIYKAPYKANNNCKDIYKFLDTVEGGAAIKNNKRLTDEETIDDHILQEYMRSDIVKQAFRIPDTLEDYVVKNHTITRNFALDSMKPYEQHYTALLDEGLSVFVVVEDFEKMYGSAGTENWIKELEWKGREAYLNDPRKMYYV